MNITIGPNEAGQRLDKFLRKLLKDVPLSAIYKIIRKGHVKVNGKKSKEKYFLVEGDEIIIKNVEFLSKKEEEFQRVDPNFKVTYDDENILIVEKWPGVLVHSDKKGGEPTLTDYALSYLNEKGEYLPEEELTFTPASCNRLDRNTSGLVIFGKNFESLKILNSIIRDRGVDKYYMALVKGKIKSGNYKGYICKDANNNISKVYDSPKPNSKFIEMEVEVIETNGLFSLLEIKLLTGRSHQIRAHLSSMGNPIIGDDKYGDKKLNSFFTNKFGLNYQFLYAYKLIFKEAPGKLTYMNNKTIAETLPPMFKKIKKDVFKF